MNTDAVATKVASIQECLADLQQRGLHHLVTEVYTRRKAKYPIIELHQAPHGFVGAAIVRIGKTTLMAAAHLGCQLRWQERES